MAERVPDRAELKRAMRAAGVTRAAVAGAAGTTKAYVNKLLDGQRPMPGHYARRLARAIEVAAAEAGKAAPQRRRCLRCGEDFESSWIGNRICRGCAQLNARAVDPRPAGRGRRVLAAGGAQ